ncbi:tautomerase family protein [Kineosporia sp. NBRC 101731]|uniref:tautomerase family protein n=1 Tax=Kineosporia sp. NBRC 101731 TaxID=3032199 RepID=UPI0024A5CC91|nr:tautomerase family protein [Kineosporia sp. NBRC 101731]GLY29268.1 4-oxalocrotonate tautomerase [Kineosporia sp. NBRC 101731]
MPLITINLQAGTRTQDERLAISTALHQAMVEVLNVPADDRFHIFNELPEGNLLHDDVVFGLPRSERMIFIAFSFNHRDADQKKALFAAAVRLLAGAGVPEHELAMMIIETARENWWAAGRVVNPRTGYDERMVEVGA